MQLKNYAGRVELYPDTEEKNTRAFFCSWIFLNGAALTKILYYYDQFSDRR